MAGLGRVSLRGYPEFAIFECREHHAHVRPAAINGRQICAAAVSRDRTNLLPELAFVHLRHRRKSLIGSSASRSESHGVCPMPGTSRAVVIGNTDRIFATVS